MRGLELQPAQLERVEQLEQQMLPRMKAAREEMRALRQQLHTLRTQPEPAWEQLQAQKVALDQARDQMHALRDELHQQVLSLLDEEQKAALWQMKPGRKGHRGRGRGRGGWGGHGRGGHGRGRGFGGPDGPPADCPWGPPTDGVDAPE